jgi:fimbrial isopeptide formation D2 family protein
MKKFKLLSVSAVAVFALVGIIFALVSQVFAATTCNSSVQTGLTVNRDAADTQLVDYQIAQPGAQALTHYRDPNITGAKPKITLTNGEAELSVADSYEGSWGGVSGTPAGAFIFGATAWSPTDYVKVRYNKAAIYGGQNVDIIATYSNITVSLNTSLSSTDFPPSLEIEKRFFAGIFFINTGEMKVSYQIVVAGTNNALATLNNSSLIVASLSAKKSGSEYTAPLSGISDVKLTPNTAVQEGTTETGHAPAYLGQIGTWTDETSAPDFLDGSAQYVLDSANISFIVGTQITSGASMWAEFYLAPTADETISQCPVAPVKTVAQKSIATGKNVPLNYTITQRTQNLGVEIFSGYASFVISDQFDARVSVDPAKITVKIGDSDATEKFDIAFNSENHTLTISAKTDTLASADFYGQEIRVSIPATATSDSTDPIENFATATIDGNAQKSNAVETTLTKTPIAATPDAPNAGVGAALRNPLVILAFGLAATVAVRVAWSIKSAKH